MSNRTERYRALAASHQQAAVDCLAQAHVRMMRSSQCAAHAGEPERAAGRKVVAAWIAELVEDLDLAIAPVGSPKPTEADE